MDASFIVQLKKKLLILELWIMAMSSLPTGHASLLLMSYSHLACVIPMSPPSAVPFSNLCLLILSVPVEVTTEKNRNARQSTMAFVATCHWTLSMLCCHHFSYRALSIFILERMVLAGDRIDKCLIKCRLSSDCRLEWDICIQLLTFHHKRLSASLWLWGWWRSYLVKCYIYSSWCIQNSWIVWIQKPVWQHLK